MEHTDTCYICFDTELNETTIISPCNNCNMYVHYSCLMNYIAVYDNNHFLCSMCHNRYDESVIRDALNIRDIIYNQQNENNINITTLERSNINNYRNYIKNRLLYIILINFIFILLLGIFVWFSFYYSNDAFPSVNIMFYFLGFVLLCYFVYFCKNYIQLYRYINRITN